MPQQLHNDACRHTLRLNLPEEKHSHGLRRLAAVEAARGSFDEAAGAVERATGDRLGKRQVEELAARTAPGSAPSGNALPVSNSGQVQVSVISGQAKIDADLSLLAAAVNLARLAVLNLLVNAGPGSWAVAPA